MLSTWSSLGIRKGPLKHACRKGKRIGSEEQRLTDGTGLVGLGELEPRRSIGYGMACRHESPSPASDAQNLPLSALRTISRAVMRTVW